LSDEVRMRHALGLSNTFSASHTSNGTKNSHRPRRFVKDGEVPVVVLNAGRDRGAHPPTSAQELAEADAALRTEQASRASAERALADALATIQRLRTQLVHAEMAHAEALDAERRKREALDRALLEAADARKSLEKQLAHHTARPVTSTKPLSCAERSRPKEPSPAKAREAKPVEWWLPSYKAKFGKKAAKSRRST